MTAPQMLQIAETKAFRGGVFIAAMMATMLSVEVTAVSTSTVTLLLPGNVPLEMIRIPAGSFQMGRYSGEQDSNANEDPQHSVNISQDLYLGKYEITKAQWQAVMGTTPWSGQPYVLNDSNSPAVYISWNDAQSFFAALDTHLANTGQGTITTRLPSEAEWEYACRAGTTTRFYWGDDPLYAQISSYAWWSGNAGSGGERYAHVVGQKLPNAFGLYDMCGNTWEWCYDWYGGYSSGTQTDPKGPITGTARMLRGRSFDSSASNSRSADRGNSGDSPTRRDSDGSFRVAGSAFIEMVSVPAGTFIMGRRDDGDDGVNGHADELPRHQVTLSAYQIGKYITTNEQYCDILNWANAKGYLKNSSGVTYNGGDVYVQGRRLIVVSDSTCQITYSAGSFSWKTRAGTAGNYSMQNHPVVCTTWYGAAAFCNFLSEIEGLNSCYDLSSWSLIDTDPNTTGVQIPDGYRLPTEAEFERASAWNGIKHWIYGFMSDTLMYKNRCNYDSSGNGTEFVNPMGFASYPYTSPVGWFNGINISPNGSILTINSPSPVGCYDMTGNAWEWCHDWYAAYSSSSQSDPFGPLSGSERIQRGADFHVGYEHCRSAGRASGSPEYYGSNSSFRVTRSSSKASNSLLLSGSISNLPTGIPAIIEATDINGSVIVSTSTDAQGSYCIPLSSGYSGYFVARLDGYNFLPFRRAYSSVVSDKDEQNFTCVPVASSQSEFDASFSVVYKREGGGPNAYPSSFCTFSSGGLIIAGSSEKDTLSIKHKKLPASSTLKSIRSIVTDKGFAKFSSDAPVNDLTATGNLRQITMTKASFGSITTSGSIKTISMTSNLRSSVEVITAIQAASVIPGYSTIALAGVEMESLSAPNQPFGSIKLTTRKSVQKISGVSATIVSPSGFVGGAGGTIDLNIASAKSISISGGKFAPNDAEGSIKSLASSGLTLAGNYYAANLSPRLFHSTADNVSITATNSDILSGTYLVDGKIGKFIAKTNSKTVGGYIGDRNNLPSYIAPTTNALSMTSSVVVAAGVKPVSDIGGQDIVSIQGTYGIYGLFLAGAAYDKTNATLTPNSKGWVKTVTTNKWLGKGYIRAYSDSTKVIKVSPPNTNIIVKLNNQE